MHTLLGCDRQRDDPHPGGAKKDSMIVEYTTQYHTARNLKITYGIFQLMFLSSFFGYNKTQKVELQTVEPRIGKS